MINLLCQLKACLPVDLSTVHSGNAGKIENGLQQCETDMQTVMDKFQVIFFVVTCKLVLKKLIYEVGRSHSIVSKPK